MGNSFSTTPPREVAPDASLAGKLRNRMRSVGLPSAAVGLHMDARARRRRVVDLEKPHMHVSLGVPHLQPIISLVAGVLILVRPKLLNYVVAIYLILSGIIGFGFIR
jgi:hypothetical protein